MSNRLRRIWWAGWFTAITVLAAGVVVNVVTRESGAGIPRAAARRVPLRPLSARAPHPLLPCVLRVGGPTKLYVCADDRAWTLRMVPQWRIVGPVTPGAQVPKS